MGQAYQLGSTLLSAACQQEQKAEMLTSEGR
jgi:hypothetical protein